MGQSCQINRTLWGWRPPRYVPAGREHGAATVVWELRRAQWGAVARHVMNTAEAVPRIILVNRRFRCNEPGANRRHRMPFTHSPDIISGSVFSLQEFSAHRVSFGRQRPGYQLLDREWATDEVRTQTDDRAARRCRDAGAGRRMRRRLDEQLYHNDHHHNKLDDQHAGADIVCSRRYLGRRFCSRRADR